MISIHNIHTANEGEHTRLYADIIIEGGEASKVWYEVENEWSQYLCDERADAFVVAILPLAMAFGHDIEVVDKPVSERLYWQLEQIYIPALAKYSNYYKPIKVNCSLNAQEFDSFAVGTGFSAGVDSFFTFYKNFQKRTREHNITHLTFFNVGANGSFGGEKASKRYEKRISLFKGFVEENGLRFVTVNSNISEFIMMSFNYTHSFRSLSVVLALQKLFRTYYYSAGVSLNEFGFDPSASGFYDLITTQMFSTESVSFYSTGCVESRIEKLIFISQFPATYKYLNVCNDHDENCRTCEKCVRTMSGLYAIKQLNKYSQVFDVPYFRKHLVHNMAFILSKQYDGTVESKFFHEIVAECRKQKVKIPILSYFVAMPMAIHSLAYSVTRRIKPLRRIVHQRISKETGIRFNDD